MAVASSPWRLKFSELASDICGSAVRYLLLVSLLLRRLLRWPFIFLENLLTPDFTYSSALYGMKLSGQLCTPARLSPGK